MAGTSAQIDTPFQMKINRPFFFTIEDRQTDAWLFVGSVVEPFSWVYYRTNGRVAKKVARERKC
ncbi:serpin family protein [Paenibacillus agricola]|uniref:Serpin domain-containing protein n=1 Tax=Paenibacillus agricola TaxID=2716264 RepID=A0ABX0JI05_9BACL|nr:serpin family protein [Paenibacillus agricola]NHN33375.1 hypothetical protein [Paenibacillus agricola]